MASIDEDAELLEQLRQGLILDELGGVFDLTNLPFMVDFPTDETGSLFDFTSILNVPPDDETVENQAPTINEPVYHTLSVPLPTIPERSSPDMTSFLVGYSLLLL